MSKEYPHDAAPMIIEYDDAGISRVLVHIEALDDYCDVTHWLMDLKSVRVASKNKTPEEKLTLEAWKLYQKALVSDASEGPKDRFVKPDEAI